MPGTVSIDSVILELRKDERSGGAHLHKSARTIMANRSQGVMDPLHFLFAATIDDFAPERVKLLLIRYDIHRGRVQEAIRHTRQVEHRRLSISQNDAYVINADTETLYRGLAFRRSVFDPAHGEWSWYVTTVQLALESTAPSIGVALQHLEGN